MEQSSAPITMQETAGKGSDLAEQLHKAIAMQHELRKRAEKLYAENAKINEELVRRGQEVNLLRMRAGLPQRKIIIDVDDKKALPTPDIKDRRFPLPESSRRAGQEGWKLAQLTSQHFEVVMEIQARCFEPVHCEEKQAYIDRLHFYPDGSIVLIVPNEDPASKLLSIPPPPGRENDRTYKPETIAGYVLFQPFFRGEIHMDDDTQGVEDRARMVKEGLRGYDCMYIHEMSVHPAFRGKGCTGPLLSYVEDCARAAGYKCVSLVSLPAANDYWIYNGFVEKYRLDYAGAASFYMEKMLDQEDT